MQIRHDSLSTAYRAPFGALPAGSEVCLRAETDASDRPEKLELRLWDGRERRYPMRFLGIREGRGLWEARIAVSQEPMLLWYRFEAFQDGERFVCGAPADGTGCGCGVMGSEESFQMTVYHPAYHTPSWMAEGVMYQIMVDRFFPGEGTDALHHAKDGEGVTLHESWDELPDLRIGENADNLANDFFGGTLEGVRQKLPYLQSLGVTVLYFNPIFYARSNHKYDTSDYTRIDPMFGDAQALSRLCQDAKAFGIRVMLDGVFSHVGDDSVYFNRRGTWGEGGAYNDPHSPYASWFSFRHWPDDYECWWGFKTLPNVNEDDEAYRHFILREDDAVVKRWLRAGTSGWRLDVADELPMSFLQELRREVKAVSPDAAVLGEVWEDASHKVAYGQMRSYVLGDTLDCVMNYPLRDTLIDFLLGRISASHAAHSLSCLLSNYPKPFLYSLMNLMGSHDRPRILNVLAGNDGNDLPRSERAGLTLTQEERMIGALREHLMLRFILSMPGMPCIYYGDEAGMEGAADPYCRRTYPWGREDQELLAYTRRLIAMRKSHAVLRTGECRVSAPCEDALIIRRTISSGQDALGQPAEDALAITLINRSGHPIDLYLTEVELGNAKRFITDTGREMMPVGGGMTVRLGSLRGVTLFSQDV